MFLIPLKLKGPIPSLKSGQYQEPTNDNPYAMVPLPDFLKIGSSAEIREVGIEKNIQK